MSTIVAASGRAGSKTNVRPSSGLGAKPTEPETIESMIASPSARAVASTAAAMIAGRAARTLIVQIARQRLTPSASAPSVQVAGTARSASTMIAIMIGVIITVRIRTATRTLEPVELHDVGHGLLALLGDQRSAHERDEHQDPDQPVDHRRHRGQQPHDRLEHPPQPLGCELDDEDRREQREDEAEHHRAERDQGRRRRAAARR